MSQSTGRCFLGVCGGEVAVYAGLIVFCFFGGLSKDEDGGSFVDELLLG